MLFNVQLTAKHTNRWWSAINYYYMYKRRLGSSYNTS